ncbi:MAG: transporter substrate-binding domain-containing protein [Pseudomonadota bacterium]
MKALRTFGLAAALSAMATVPALAQSALNEILDSGVLKVGTTGDWNPMSLRDPASGGYKGFDVDVMSALAADLGVELEFVPTTWGTLVNGIQAGQYHATGSASISPSRAKVAGFSASYISVEIFPFTSEENAGRFDSWEAINQPDVTVATTLGTTFEAYTREWFPNAEIIVVEAPARGYQEVFAGRADVFVTSNIEGSTLTEQFPIAKVDVEPRAPSPIAMLLPQGDQVWINYVNHWITVKQMGGFFDETRSKWGL